MSGGGKGVLGSGRTSVVGVDRFIVTSLFDDSNYYATITQRLQLRPKEPQPRPPHRINYEVIMVGMEN